MPRIVGFTGAMREDDNMQITRRAGHAPQSEDASREAARIPGCIGCAGCTGLCRSLIDLITTPDAILEPRK